MTARIETVAVIGAGTMGHGIAQVAAMGGYTALLVDTGDDLVERGLAQVRNNLDRGVERGKVEATVREAALERIEGTTELTDAARRAQLVIEAVPERLELKLEVFRQAEAVTAADTILATNTSSLSVSELQRGLDVPARVLGLHFFNPVHIMKLVEVIRGEETAADVVEAGVAFAERLGKEPIVVRDSPGFASSRLGIALGLEAIRMVEEEVASPEDIDKAMVLGYRHPMGPLRLTDLVGLDVRLDIAEYLHDALGDDRFRPPALLRRMVDAGKLGKKAGQGFYSWEE